MSDSVRTSARARLPVPGAFVSRPDLATESDQTTRATKYCSNPDHHTTADCVAAAEARVEPVNGTQTCALVATKNSILAFRRLMRWNDPDYTSAQPPAEHATAGEIWTKFEGLMNGCVDHVCANMSAADIDAILGVFVDFADPLRASLALAVRLYGSRNPIVAVDDTAHRRHDDELARQLRRQLADDPLLKYLCEHATGR